MNLRHLIAIIALLLPWAAFSKEVPPPTDPPRLAVDFTGTLSDAELDALEQKLVAYDDSTSTQIAVVIENSLEGDDIFDYSFRLAEAWGIGRQGKNNGVLVYIALEDRELRIQTGYGAEGFLPDAMAKRIIEQIIVPNFKQGAYFEGLNQATDVIMKLGSGEYVNEDFGGGQGEDAIGNWVLFVILAIIFLLVFLGGKGGRGGGYSRHGRYGSGGLPWMMFGPGSGGGGGSSWGSGGGGGGFGGFGGGSFGGGGAGGSW